MGQRMPAARLLPWATTEGKPCYLLSDGRGSGAVSRVADTIESVQLDMAARLRAHVAELLSGEDATAEQLRFALERMGEALGDVARVAESRGARVSVRDRGDEPGPESGPLGH